MAEPAQATEVETFPRLERSPIVEVVCGLHFPAVAGLDSFEFGVYWDRRQDEYPGRQVQPALVDGLTFNLGPTRAWLIGPQGEWLQQIQADRFYVNWRRQGTETDYPHFSDTTVEGVARPGVKSRALAEFEKFTGFCEERDTISGVPTPSHVELSKIDSLAAGREWDGLEDLASLLPIVSDFIKLSRGDALSVNLQVQEVFDGGRITVRIQSQNDPGSGAIGAVRLDTRVVLELAGRTLEQAFTEANVRQNRMFFQLLPQAAERWGKKDV